MHLLSAQWWQARNFHLTPMYPIPPTHPSPFWLSPSYDTFNPLSHPKSPSTIIMGFTLRSRASKIITCADLLMRMSLTFADLNEFNHIWGVHLVLIYMFAACKLFSRHLKIDRVKRGKMYECGEGRPSGSFSVHFKLILESKCFIFWIIRYGRCKYEYILIFCNILSMICAVFRNQGRENVSMLQI